MIRRFALSAPAFAADPPADTIWRGGPIVTVDDARPSAEAVAVRDGHIVAVGTAVEVMRLRGPDTRVVDLAGKTLVPGFIDGHGHVSMVGFQAVSANLLPPPTGVIGTGNRCSAPSAPRISRPPGGSCSVA